MINAKKEDLKFLLNPIKSKKFLLIFFLSIIIILALLESSIVGSILPIVEFIDNKENILKYNRIFNEVFSLDLDLNNFIKIFLQSIAVIFLIIGY